MPSDPPDNNTNPLNEFSGCHEGIITNFHQLRELLTLHQQSPDNPQIQQLAQKLVKFFQDVVLTHHAEEEQELFTAVMQAAADEDEASTARTQIKRLVAEHRELEAMWQKIEPDMKQLAKGKPAALAYDIAAKLAQQYHAHAQFEEEIFLPSTARILTKNDLSALGLSLHMRHQQVSTKFYI